jgi:hypothetical protein
MVAASSRCACSRNRCKPQPELGHAMMIIPISSQNYTFYPHYLIVFDDVQNINDIFGFAQWGLTSR